MNEKSARTALRFGRLCFVAYSPFIVMQLKDLAAATRRRLRLLTDVCEDTAVNVKDMTVYEVGSVGRKEYCGTCQIFRFAPTLCGGFSYDKAVERMTRTVGLTLS